jgi:prepilin-type N-terminal cleavage/methylation domain-containing protein
MRRGEDMIQVKDQDGLTLVEIILSIALLSIVIVAVFSGLNYAYNVLFSSKELSEQTYEIQKEYEQELTKVRLLPQDTTQASYDKVDDSRVIDDQPIVFDWDSEDLEDFSAEGLTIIKEGKGGGYLEESIYMFIPLYTEEESP